jgi:hypothetical protein
LLASLSAALRVNALKLSPTFTAASEIAAFAVSLASEINYCKDIAVLF